MIKRTLYFCNPAFFKTSNEQLVLEDRKSGETKQVPIEDTGVVIADNQQLTFTQALPTNFKVN